MKALTHEGIEDRYIFRLGWHRYLLTIFPLLYTVSSVLLYDPDIEDKTTLYIRIFAIIFSITSLVLSYTSKFCKRNIEYFAYFLVYLVVINTALTVVEKPQATMLILYGIVIMLCTYVYATKWFFRLYIALTLSCTSYIAYKLYAGTVSIDPITLKSSIAVVIVQITLFIHSYAFFQERQHKDEEWLNEIHQRKKIQKEKDKLTEVYHIVTENIPVELALFRVENVNDSFTENILYDYINEQYEPNIEKRNLLLNSNEISLMKKSKYKKEELVSLLKRFEKIETSILLKKPTSFIETRKYMNGDERIIERKIIPIIKSNDEIKHVLFTGLDITEETKMKDKIIWEATHDGLTSIFNKKHIVNKIRKKIKLNETFGLCILDLDNFKEVNDTLGHDAGDQVLIELSNRLRANFKNSVLGRMGGDEFIIVANGVKTQSQINNFKEKLIHTFSIPFKLAGEDFIVTSSSGLSLYPSHVNTELDENDAVSLLLKHADISLYKSKRNGKGTLTVYRDL